MLASGRGEKDTADVPRIMRLGRSLWLKNITPLPH